MHSPNCTQLDAARPTHSLWAHSLCATTLAHSHKYAQLEKAHSWSAQFQWACLASNKVNPEVKQRGGFSPALCPFCFLCSVLFARRWAHCLPSELCAGPAVEFRSGHLEASLLSFLALQFVHLLLCEARRRLAICGHLCGNLLAQFWAVSLPLLGPQTVCSSGPAAMASGATNGRGESLRPCGYCSGRLFLGLAVLGPQLRLAAHWPACERPSRSSNCSISLALLRPVGPHRQQSAARGSSRPQFGPTARPRHDQC